MPVNPNYIELISFAVYGLAVVFTVLCSLVFFCYVLRFLLTLAPRIRRALVEPQARALNERSATKEHSKDDVLDPEVVAVITAAIESMLDQKTRVIKIRPQSDGERSWTQEIRSRHHSSHVTR